MSFKTVKKQPTLLRKPYVLVWPVVLVLAIAAILYRTTGLFGNHPVAISGNAYTKGENATTPAGVKSQVQSTSSGTSNASGTSPQPGDTKGDVGSSTSATLIVPSGNFVSNHHPNLSSSPAPNILNSVCATTPGASCVISFTKDGTTRSLPAQTTDRGGSTYWNGWSLQSIGLTSGSWQIQATATLNGKSLHTTDALALVVGS